VTSKKGGGVAHAFGKEENVRSYRGGEHFCEIVTKSPVVPEKGDPADAQKKGG